MDKRYMFFIIILIFACTLSRSQVNALQDNLYYKNIIRLTNAANLLKEKELKSSYIVILDSGIEYAYKKQYEGRYIYGTRCVPAWGEYHRNPWTSYEIGINHGTQVQFICDEIIKALGVNDENKRSSSQSVMTIQYKISEANGLSQVERLIFAINDVIDYYVLEENLNIAAINFSSVITFRKEDEKIPEVKRLKNELEEAIDRAASYGITFVTAAGNDNSEINNYSAKLDNVIVVGSTDSSNNRALWGAYGGSGFGEDLDIVAPGDKVLVFSNESNSVVDSGTSYSVPMVSTTIGLMKALDPTLKPDEIEKILKSSATDLGRKGKDDYFGNGLLNVEETIEKVIK
ncbi:MAG: S8/S53 family peptidase [Clostridium sp.]